MTAPATVCSGIPVVDAYLDDASGEKPAIFSQTV